MDPFNWTCAYCGQPTTITEPNYSYNVRMIETEDSKYGSICVLVRAIACPNPSCKELTLEAMLHRYGFPKGQNAGSYAPRERFHIWKLLPRSRARPQPDYIPKQIRSDYEEACLILNDSPKASATLSRRCLQGIVRDFWHIPENKRGNLGAELSFIRDQVDSDTWDAIQAIRSVGDIGAHMEKDVNLIVDVEPREAELLVNLIETLLEDWYVERHKRRERNAAVKDLARDKLQAKKAGKPATINAMKANDDGE
jgi:Domain of unknown function (DUF4145)